MAKAKIDANRHPTLIGVSKDDPELPVRVAVDPSTGELLIHGVIMIAWVTTALTLTDANVAYKTPTSELSGRKLLILYNVSNVTVYVGDSSVTTVNGIAIVTGATLLIDAEKDLYTVCGSAGKIINILEGK